MNAVMRIPATLGIGLVWLYRVTFGALFPTTCKYHPSCSEYAVQAVKRQVTATIADHVLAREAQEQELGDKVRTSRHFAEGVAAFREKRRPHYE